MISPKFNNLTLLYLFLLLITKYFVNRVCKYSYYTKHGLLIIYEVSIIKQLNVVLHILAFGTQY